MHSIWTRLLFLHGHVAYKDLVWCADARQHTQKTEPPVKAHRTLLARCATVWPRLIGPH